MKHIIIPFLFLAFLCTSCALGVHSRGVMLENLVELDAGCCHGHHDDFCGYNYKPFTGSLRIIVPGIRIEAGPARHHHHWH